MKLNPRPADEWRRLLTAAGCRSATADRWSMIFAACLQGEVFSQGEKDLADFLPTVLVESARLEKLVENGNYSAQRIRELGMQSAPGSRWRGLADIAQSLAYNEEAFFEACYGGRMGNNQPGDGSRYRGRGLIMLTGKDNYAWQGRRSGQDLLVLPELAAQPTYALQFAIDWWEGRVPDSALGDAKAVRRVVNGGSFGLAEVQEMKAKLQRAGL